MAQKPNEMIQRLAMEDKEFILIGTAHVSNESVQLVASVIKEEAPDTVCIELCGSRYQAIRQQNRWKETDIVKVIKEGKAFLLLANLLLASFQKRIAKKIGVKPGAEMLAAIETAEEVGAQIHLADRDIRITMSRAWRYMSLWMKLKLLFQIILSIGEVDEISEADIEQMKQADILQTLLADVEKSLPIIRAILIDERDSFLTHRIRNAPGKKIVAVVGAGHVPGIVKLWESTLDIHPLNAIPPKGVSGRLLKWILPLAIMGVFIWGFFSGGSNVGGHMLTWWVAANGILAGLGALLAWAHPFTILASVLAAPLTSLNPMIAAGWVSGLVEAFTRKPKVKDFENLTQDILSVKGFWKNKITRILLVVVFTNLGSTLGTMVAIPLMLKVL